MSDINYDEVVHIDLVGRRKVYSEAAYETLRAERDRLRETLEKIAGTPCSLAWQQHLYDIIDMARAALKENNDD